MKPVGPSMRNSRRDRWGQVPGYLLLAIPALFAVVWLAAVFRCRKEDIPKIMESLARWGRK
jgi:hypothetical protein